MILIGWLYKLSKMIDFDRVIRGFTKICQRYIAKNQVNMLLFMIIGIIAAILAILIFI